MQTKTKAQSQLKKSFLWNISSETISFVPSNDLSAARDGSGGGNCGDCTNVSPFPEPKKKRHQKAPRTS